MKKAINEKQVVQTEWGHFCDYCERPLDKKFKITLDSSWSDGYDYYGDNEEIEACSIPCFMAELIRAMDGGFDLLRQSFSPYTIKITLPGVEANTVLSELAKLSFPDPVPYNPEQHEYNLGRPAGIVMSVKELLKGE